MIVPHLTTNKPSPGLMLSTGDTVLSSSCSDESYGWLRALFKRPAPDVVKGRGRPTKATANTLKPYLCTFTAPGHALAKAPGFDDIITGAVNLDLGGNTRPLSKKVVIRLLQELDSISTKSVQTYMQLTMRSCAVRHAQKIAKCLRIIITACTSLLNDTSLNDNGINDPSMHLSPSGLEPCGNSKCTICTDGAAVIDVDEEHDSWELETHDYLDSDAYLN